MCDFTHFKLLSLHTVGSYGSLDCKTKLEEINISFRVKKKIKRYLCSKDPCGPVRRRQNYSCKLYFPSLLPSSFLTPPTSLSRAAMWELVHLGSPSWTQRCVQTLSLCGCLNLNLGFTTKQDMLLTKKPSLKPSTINFW